MYDDSKNSCLKLCEWLLGRCYDSLASSLGHKLCVKSLGPIVPLYRCLWWVGGGEKSNVGLGEYLFIGGNTCGEYFFIPGILRNTCLFGWSGLVGIDFPTTCPG